MSREQLFDQPDFLPKFDDLAPLAGARVALTGHRGVLGGILLRRCLAAGLSVSSFEHDVTDAAAVETWLTEASPDLVFHCAAKVAVSNVENDPVRAYAVNALGPYQVAAAVIRHAPKAWLFLASTSHVYGPRQLGASEPIGESGVLSPATLYGASKLAGEQLALPLLERMQIACSVGRIFSFSHASQRPPYLVPNLVRSIFSLPDGAELELKSAHSVRDIVDAETVADALLHLAVRRHRGVVNVGSGQGLSIEQIAHRVAGKLGRSIRVQPVGSGPENSLVADVSALKKALREVAG